MAQPISGDTRGLLRSALGPSCWGSRGGGRLPSRPFALGGNGKGDSEHEDSDHPPNQEQRYKCADDVAQPLAGGTWSAKSEHAAMVAN